MDDVWYYTNEFLRIMAISLTVIVPVRLLCALARRRRGLTRSTALHEIGIVLFLSMLAALACATIVPAMEWDGQRLQFLMDGGGRNTQLGRVFRDTYYISYLWGNHSYFWLNIVGNILLFLPIGLLTPLLWPRWRRWGLPVALGLLISLSIEFSQLFIGRGADVDDVWLNTLGALLGYLLFRLLARRCPRFCAACAMKKEG